MDLGSSEPFAALEGLSKLSEQRGREKGNQSLPIACEWVVVGALALLALHLCIEFAVTVA